MTTRTYRCTLQTTISVDDVTLKAAVLGFTVPEDPDSPLTIEQRLQENEQLRAMGDKLPPEILLQTYLSERYGVHLAMPLKRALEQWLPDSEVALPGGVTVELVAAED